MTIRRNVDLAAINRAFMAFEEGCASAPDGVFEQAKNIRDRVLGYSADEFLRVAKSNEMVTCNCDGIREIEIMMFDMIRRENPGSEIEGAIGLGRTLIDHPETRDRVLAGLQRDRDFVAGVTTDAAVDDLLDDVLGARRC